MSEEVRAPLFDRFGGGDRLAPREAGVSRTLSRAELAESVRRELQRLFNTRCPLPADPLAQRPRTVLEYGIPDLSELSPNRQEDRNRLERELEKAILAYEPRLRQPQVSVQPPDTDSVRHRHYLSARIEGVLIIDSVAEPVLFPTLFGDADSNSEEVRVDAHG